MEIAIVIIIVLIAAIITVAKLRKILAGKDSNCACTHNCPFAGDNKKCTGYRSTCGYSKGLELKGSEQDKCQSKSE